MEMKKTAGQVLVETLMKISEELSRFIKVFEKFEGKQEGEDKDSLEFRVEIINQIKTITEKLKDVLTKLDIMDDKFLKIINELNLSISKQERIDYSKVKSIMEDALRNIGTKICEECVNCPILIEKDKVIKEKELWIKRLVIALAVVIGFIILLLGLNVFDYIKLPGMR